MSELDTVVAAAYASEGQQEKVNKVYVTLFRTLLYMPVYTQDDEDEPFSPLYLEDAGKYFIPIFDSLERLQAWTVNEYENLEYAEILGADVIRCIGEAVVYLCLNAGTDYYKEFSPDEILHLKKMLTKIDTLKQ